MIETITETVLAVLDSVSKVIPIDIVSVHEDMAGKNGPLVGPQQVGEFIAPYYRKVWELLESRGTRIFDQDSDGDMRPLLDVFVNAGVNCMHPMEPAAGMDILEIREQYGKRLAFYGGLDKYALQRGEEAIAEELENKIPPMVQSGGCVLGLDHRIPPGTPLEAYRFYIAKAWEIIERESAS
jgi:uroporphyrinogen-III decarboxylase